MQPKKGKSGLTIVGILVILAAAYVGIAFWQNMWPF